MEEYIHDFCIRELNASSLIFGNDSVSLNKISETVEYARRDLKRIAHDLHDSVSRQKFAGYYGFWFAKLAPLSAVFREDGDEVVDISERLAILLIHELMLAGIGTVRPIESLSDFDETDQAAIGYNAPAVPLVWSTCRNTCTGQCFTMGLRRYLGYHEWQNFEYLVRLLRHRTAGPYELVSILEAAVIVSCTGVHP